MTNENRPSVKKLKQKCSPPNYELIYGEKALQLLMESIRKPTEVRAKEFEQRVAKKVAWLKVHDPHSLEFYLASPY